MTVLFLLLGLQGTKVGRNSRSLTWVEHLLYLAPSLWKKLEEREAVGVPWSAEGLEPLLRGLPEWRGLECGAAADSSA